jgi:hypothetical protein
MVHHPDCKALFGRVHGGTFGDGPRFEDTVVFETEVPVEMGGVVFLDDEAGHG